jgi:hypothetical protein
MAAQALARWLIGHGGRGGLKGLKGLKRLKGRKSLLVLSLLDGKLGNGILGQD